MKFKFLILLVFASALDIMASGSVAPSKIVFTGKDKVILQEKMAQFSKLSNLSTGELMLKIGNDFIGTPYVAKTLDTGMAENLIVNLREFDCTTFVENCLAIARTIKGGHPTFESFIKELEKIRYRNGQLDGYVSRLHYFGEWINDNQTKGIVKDVTRQIGGIKCPVLLNFMSNHPEYYPQLKGNPALIKEISQIEKKLSEGSFSYIPKDKIAGTAPNIADGDIVALVTKIPGMDVSHVGLLYLVNGNIYMLHASSTGGKVETTLVPLTDYLKNSKNTTGIFVIRAL